MGMHATRGIAATSFNFGLGITVLTIAALALTGCSDSDGKTLGTATTPSSTVTPSTNTNGEDTLAPQIENPLPAERFAKDACSTLTEQQTSELGINQSGRQNGDDGCSWRFGPNLEYVVQVGLFATPDGKGLENTYKQNAAGWYKDGYFKPTTVGNYPAVYSNPVDLRPGGTCDLSVGISDAIILHVTVRGPANEDNCQATSVVAADVIDTIKAGGQ
ncbi:hypothetical protein GCM10017786_38370 [Amycolatopsis deserti]|uniref:DUF3558 domain-containing protein n=1 Tax=Amycolatopsis deserti TaxID=185696 RepID=A0ABQ3J223_9PSEU|nr:DUF3558 domain-containing protein [Amycolatopsis deserti]GHF01614.1 hypothetical protein GCM10017786_38370 [Amycolatopsis deserti]